MRVCELSSWAILSLEELGPRETSVWCQKLACGMGNVVCIVASLTLLMQSVFDLLQQELLQPLLLFSKIISVVSCSYIVVR